MPSPEPKTPAGPPDDDPTFIADVNVGKLAKWLRILGYDTLFINPIDDGRLVDIALREGRVVLTRDTHIPERRVVTSGLVRVVVVQGDRVGDQLRFLDRELGLKRHVALLSRCLECNSSLQPIDRSLVGHRVPPYVYRTQERYMVCPRCDKIYWAGSHWERMSRTAGDMMGGESPAKTADGPDV